jgi:NCAIR mutase (PurE)-related protein
LPFEDLGFANIDAHRALRCGFPEVIFCEGKRTEDILNIADRILSYGADLLATRVSTEPANALLERFPDARYYQRSRVVICKRSERPHPPGRILVISAGTSDIPVAEEAQVTAEIMDNDVEVLFDVGVAGIHRLLGRRRSIMEANVLIVVAGMEGALASVVGGLVDRPVIAVPTSIGYGANFQGLAPLLTMLNCCAAGVAVVNIDNGFGAGYLASLINHIGVDRG